MSERLREARYFPHFKYRRCLAVVPVASGGEQPAAQQCAVVEQRYKNTECAKENQSTLALKVSQDFIFPDCKPALNQAMRCLLLPWVKLSGCA